jgi:hypothetical protein
MPTVGVDGVEMGAATVTVDVAEDVADSGVEALSVTLSSNEYVWPAVSVPDAMAHVSVAAAPAPVPLFVVHWVASTKEPPLSDTNHCHE